MECFCAGEGRRSVAGENLNMGEWEWILVPTLIGAGTGLVLSNFNCHRFGGRILGFVGHRVEGTIGGFLIGALIGVVVGVLSEWAGGGSGKRWLNGLGTGGTVGLLAGWLEDEEGEGPAWYLGLIAGGMVGCALRLLVYVVEHCLLTGIK
jgi:hypothetical protein